MIDNPDMAKKGKRKPKPRVTADVGVQAPEIRIAPGKRAFAIRLGAEWRGPNALQPGSQVDVVAVIESADGGKVAKFFMTDVRLLAFGVMATRGSEPVTVAALEVTPKEAEALAVAGQASTLHLVLHGSVPPGKSLTEAVLGAAVGLCSTSARSEPLLTRACPTRNPPPEFVAPRR